MEEWITVREASELVGYREDYVRKLAREGQVGSRKFGWQVMINKESIEKYKKEKDQWRVETGRA